MPAGVVGRAGVCAGNGAVAGERRVFNRHRTFVFVPLLAAAPTPTKQRRNHGGCARAFASAALPAKAQTQETRRELPSYTMRASDQKAMLPTTGKAGQLLLACAVVVVKLFGSGFYTACFQHHVTASGKGQPSSFASHFMFTMT